MRLQAPQLTSVVRGVRVCASPLIERALMMKMGELIPQLQSRASKSAASTQAAGGGSTKKKKGKR